jgi:hypothetical protein
MTRTLPTLDQIGPNTPLRLDVAAAIAYPDGSMTGKGLRKEAARGKLIIERTAGKLYTTLASIEKMREKCRLQVKDQDSGCARPAGEAMAAMPFDQPHGSSETERIRQLRDAWQAIVPARNARSKHISPRST